MRDRSKVLKAAGFRWQGVEVREYKADGAPYKDVTRQTLLGEGEGEADLTFITRYFEIQPGGYSTLERHRSEEHTSELQSLAYLVCRLLLEKKKTKRRRTTLA